MPEKTRRKTMRMKVCVVGNPGVGKTYLIRHLTGSEQPIEPTEEYEVSLYNVSTKFAYMEIQLWDCSGHHFQFHKYLRQAFFRHCSAALLVFNFARPDWQQQAHVWISEAYESQCYLVYAVANKIGRPKSRVKKWRGLECEKPLLEEEVEQMKVQAEEFFKKYQIKLHFLEDSENICINFEELFAKMHEESIVVSRKSVARGMQLPFEMQEGLLEKESEQIKQPGQ